MSLPFNILPQFTITNLLDSGKQFKSFVRTNTSNLDAKSEPGPSFLSIHYVLVIIRKKYFRRPVLFPPFGIANIGAADEMRYDLPISAGLFQKSKQIVVKSSRI